MREGIVGMALVVPEWHRRRLPQRYVRGNVEELSQRCVTRHAVKTVVFCPHPSLPQNSWQSLPQVSSFFLSETYDKPTKNQPFRHARSVPNDMPQTCKRHANVTELIMCFGICKRHANLHGASVNCDRASCPTLPLYHVTELCQQKNAMKNILFCGWHYLKSCDILANSLKSHFGVNICKPSYSISHCSTQCNYFFSYSTFPNSSKYILIQWNCSWQGFRHGLQWLEEETNMTHYGDNIAQIYKTDIGIFFVRDRLIREFTNLDDAFRFAIRTGYKHSFRFYKGLCVYL